MKKFLALILASLLLVGCLGCFAGCGRDTADETPAVSYADITEPVVDEPVMEASATDISATDVSVTDTSASDM